MRPSVTVTPLPDLDVAGFDARFLRPGELARLVTLVASVAPRTMLEFGCRDGRAAAVFLHNVPSLEQYVGIDRVPGLRTPDAVPPGQLAAADPRFRLLLRRHGAFDLTSSDLPFCDAVFIDAELSRAGVLGNTALALAVVRQGGIIVWHNDNRLPQMQVSEALDELAAGGIEISHVEGTWLAFARV